MAPPRRRVGREEKKKVGATAATRARNRRKPRPFTSFVAWMAMTSLICQDIRRNQRTIGSRRPKPGSTETPSMPHLAVRRELTESFISSDKTM